MRYTISWSMLSTVYWSRDEGGIGWSKFLLEPALECSFVYYVAPLLRGRLYVIKDTATEKEFDVAIKCHWSTLVQRSKKIEMDEKSNF